MSGPMLQLRNLTKRFGLIAALRGISLDLAQDELLVVLGATGAGKTTLLRTIAGLETPDEGSILMGERDVTGWPPAQRDVALVFQNFSLYPDRTVRQNMEFPLRAPGRNLSKDQIRQRVEWAAEILRISHLLDRKSNRLSGGEMQRVAIGRAIVRRPRLFLMDEPLTNLDAKLRESLRVELIQLRRELKAPMIYVTHDQAEALSMGDRIVALSEGRVLQTGTPEEIYRRPVSPAVARQLGQPAINILKVLRSDGHWATQAGEPILPANGRTSDRALIGVRPEDIAPTGGERPATVKVVEDMGPALVLLVDWLGSPWHLMAPKTSPVKTGDTLYPKINPDRVVFWQDEPVLSDHPRT